jgi:hypothetical protein
MVGRRVPRHPHHHASPIPQIGKSIMSSNPFSGSYFSPKELGPGVNTSPRPKINTQAVVAAVCATLGFVTAVGFFGGIIFGHIALSRIKRSNGHESGRRLALAAVVVSWIPIILVALVFGLLVLIGFATPAQH